LGRIKSGRLSAHLVSSHFRFLVVPSRVGSDRLSRHLVSNHFEFWVGSVIGSSNVGSFQVSDSIKSGRIGYRVISGFELYQTRSKIKFHHLYVSDLVRSDESGWIKFLSDACLSYIGFTLILN
jgi:hypothetical protein